MSTGEQKAPDPARVLEWARGWARFTHATHGWMYGPHATCRATACVEARELLWPDGVPE